MYAFANADLNSEPGPVEDCNWSRPLIRNLDRPGASLRVELGWKGKKIKNGW